MFQAATETETVFVKHYVDLAEATAMVSVVQRLHDIGLVTFDGLTGRGDVIGFASQIMSMISHRDSDPDGLTTIRDTPGRPSLAGYSGLGCGELLPHTDGTSIPEPPRLMMLVCECPADQGGECLLTDGQRVHADLVTSWQEAAMSLSQPRTAFFGAGDGHSMQVFTMHPGRRVTMRLRQDDLARWSPMVARYVPCLCEVIACHQQRLMLIEGQGYLLDNHRWLHARTQFSGDRRFLRALGSPHAPLALGFAVSPNIHVPHVTSDAA